MYNLDLRDELIKPVPLYREHNINILNKEIRPAEVMKKLQLFQVESV